MFVSSNDPSVGGVIEQNIVYYILYYFTLTATYVSVFVIPWFGTLRWFSFSIPMCIIIVIWSIAIDCNICDNHSDS